MYIIIFEFLRERTTMMSILSGLGMAVLPLANFASGQLFKVVTYKEILIIIKIKAIDKLQIGGYYLVYGTSLGFSVLGMIYIKFIPETITEKEIESQDQKDIKFIRKITISISDGYK